MKKAIIAAVIALALTACGAASDGADNTSHSSQTGVNEVKENTQTDGSSGSVIEVDNTENVKIAELEKGLSSVRFEGDYKFDRFLSEGGAESDSEVIAFLTKNIIGDAVSNLGESIFGCSAFSAKGENGYYFGRNFDWYNCDALVVTACPDSGYASISTVNTDFIGIMTDLLDDKSLTTAAIYGPLDGMNEKGLCVSVNYVQDNESVDQKTDKPDITTTTAIRLMLDKAADVDEAISLLEQYDMHASKGMTVHFAVADAGGRCVAVEYLGNEMIVTETPVVTNFYFAEGDKNGVGTQQSHERYDILMQTLADKDSFTSDEVMDALNSVSKHNYDDGETTEWSAVFDQSTGEVVYCHRENFDKKYTFDLNG